MLGEDPWFLRLLIEKEVLATSCLGRLEDIVITGTPSALICEDLQDALT